MPDPAVATPPRNDIAVLGTGVLAAATAAALIAAAAGGRPVMVAVLVPVQAVLVVSWLVALRAPGRLGGVLIGLGAAVIADVVVATGNTGVRRLAGVIGVSLVVALIHQLVRRGGRPGATASLSATVSGAVLVVSAATIIALRGGAAGTAGVQTALGAVAAALLVGRIGDLVLPRPRLGQRLRRGWPGVLLGLVSAAVVGALVGSARSVLGTGEGVALALAAAVVAVTADIGVELARATGASAPRPGPEGFFPLAVVLPIAAAAPVAYVTGRIMLG